MATFFFPQGREVKLYLETIPSCWKVMSVLAFFFLLLEIVEPQRKKKKRKKRRAEQVTEAGELCDTTFHLSPYIITKCEFLCSVKNQGQFV